MDVDKNTFYNAKKVAIVPMGFCHPGKGRVEICRREWNAHLSGMISCYAKMPSIELALLIGKYAQDYDLESNTYRTLTEAVKHFEEYLPQYFVCLIPLRKLIFG